MQCRIGRDFPAAIAPLISSERASRWEVMGVWVCEVASGESSGEMRYNM